MRNILLAVALVAGMLLSLASAQGSAICAQAQGKPVETERVCVPAPGGSNSL